MSEHISRKELKHDKIKETFEHGAEAVISHGQFALIVITVALVAIIGYSGWHFYIDNRTKEATGAFDVAMKAYQGRIGATPNPADPIEPVYPTDEARVQDSVQEFTGVADRYSNTNPGKLARYYESLCLEDLDRHNQAIEELKKISSGRDKELAAMAQYQTAMIYARTDRPAEAIKILRALADKPPVLVPRPLVLLELAGVLKKTNPQEAATLYQQIKRDFPDTPMADQADRGLDEIAPKS